MGKRGEIALNNANKRLIFILIHFIPFAPHINDTSRVNIETHCNEAVYIFFSARLDFVF